MRNYLRTVAMMVRISLRADTPRSVAVLLTATGQMVAPPLTAIGLKHFADAILAASVGGAVRGVLLIVSFAAFGRLCTHASFNVRVGLRENTQLYLDAQIMRTTAGIAGLEHHERADYLNEVELIRAERRYLANPFNPISWSLASIAQGVTVVVLLWQVHPLLALLPLAGVPTAIITGKVEQAAIGLRQSQAERNRRMRHLLELAVDVPAAKEVRISSLAQALVARRRRGFAELEREHVAFAKRDISWSAIGVACFASGYALAVIGAVGLADRGAITVGSVVLVLSLGAQIDGQVAEMATNLAWFIRTHRAVERLRWFEDYAASSAASLEPDVPSAVPVALRDGISFEGVSFAYPGTSQPVLAGVDLHIPAGTTVAIVGENGAGKTTLVKLLARFYEPTAGVIRVDGVPLTSHRVEEWRSVLSAGFQDFAKFELYARETVGLGDVEQEMADAPVLAGLERAAGSSVVAALPAGLDTQLGRQFEGGVDLSIGQWQKLAMGRAMMRRDPLLRLLDEPTASLDAITEQALFDRFHSSSREGAAHNGAITVLVSHRFSTVRMADLIVVVEDGRISEAGSHEELMAMGGTYSELYELQARSYR